MLLLLVCSAAAPDGLAINGDELSGTVGTGVAGVCFDTTAELHRIEQWEEVDNGLFDRDPVGQADPFSELLTVEVGELNRSREGLHATDQCADGDEYDLAKVMFPLSSASRIFNDNELLEAGGETSRTVDFVWISKHPASV